MSDDLAWIDDALCAQTDTEIFFPAAGESNTDAKKVCNRCDVRAECLAYALQHDFIGVWGGLSRQERRRLQETERKRRTRAAARAKEAA